MTNLGHPRMISQGFRDTSGRVVTLPPVIAPTYVPLVFLLAEKGDYKPRLVSAPEGYIRYGVKTFEKASKYYTHQTELATITFAEGTPILALRVPVEDSSKATLRLSAELIRSDVNDYDDGYRIVWHATQIPNGQYKAGEIDSSFRNGNLLVAGQYLGRYTQGEGTNFDTSVLYPILDIEMDSDGVYGNNTGIEIWPTTVREGLRNIATVIGSYVYNFKIKTRDKVNAPSLDLLDVLGVPHMSFVLDPDALYPKTNKPFFLQNQYQSSYMVGTANVGGLDAPYVYQDNVNTVLRALWEKEKDYDADIPDTISDGWLLSGDVSKANLINFFTGKQYDGSTNYKTFTVDVGGYFGGVNFAQGSTLWASGGDDGIPVKASGLRDKLSSMKCLDDSVLRILNSFDSLEYELLDYAKTEFTAIIDTGFSLAVKDAMMKAHDTRKDIVIIQTPFRYADYVGEPDVIIPDPPSPQINGRLTPTAPSDSGILGDNKTINRSPRIIGTTIPNSTIVMVLNSITYNATANGSGSWFIDIPVENALPNGTYTPVLTITSPLSVVATGNGTLFTVGAAPTVTGFLTPVNPNDTGVLGDNQTTNTTPTIGGATTANSTVDVIIDGEIYHTTSNGSGAWSIAIPPQNALVIGTYIPAITVTDPLGNVTQADGTAFTIVEDGPIQCASVQSDVAIDLDPAALFTATVDGVVLGTDLAVEDLITVLGENDMEAVAMWQTARTCHVFSQEEIDGLIANGSGVAVFMDFYDNLDRASDTSGDNPRLIDQYLHEYDVVITSNGESATYRDLHYKLAIAGSMTSDGSTSPAQIPVNGGVLNVLGIPPEDGQGDQGVTMLFWISTDYDSSNLSEVLIQFCPRVNPNGDPDQGIDPNEVIENRLYNEDDDGYQSLMVKLVPDGSFSPDNYYPV